MKLVRALVICMFVGAGCASSYDLRKGERSPFGAGVAVRPVKPGLFAINVQMSAMPAPDHAGAIAQWRQLASEACLGRTFEEASIQPGVTELTGPLFGLVPYKVATRYGYAICEGAQLTRSELDGLRGGEYYE